MHETLTLLSFLHTTRAIAKDYCVDVVLRRRLLQIDAQMLGLKKRLNAGKEDQFGLDEEEETALLDRAAGLKSVRDRVLGMKVRTEKIFGLRNVKMAPGWGLFQEDTPLSELLVDPPFLAHGETSPGGTASLGEEDRKTLLKLRWNTPTAWDWSLEEGESDEEEAVFALPDVLLPMLNRKANRLLKIESSLLYGSVYPGCGLGNKADIGPGKKNTKSTTEALSYLRAFLYVLKNRHQLFEAARVVLRRELDKSPGLLALNFDDPTLDGGLEWFQRSGARLLEQAHFAASKRLLKLGAVRWQALFRKVRGFAAAARTFLNAGLTYTGKSGLGDQLGRTSAEAVRRRKGSPQAVLLPHTSSPCHATSHVRSAESCSGHLRRSSPVGCTVSFHGFFFQYPRALLRARCIGELCFRFVRTPSS